MVTGMIRANYKAMSIGCVHDAATLIAESQLTITRFVCRSVLL